MILSRDLAYDHEFTPPDRAADLANRFLAELGNETLTFYTNGTFHLGRDAGPWMPVTKATFDTGLLIIGPVRSGCLWVEDED